jgi:hypothetical protein
MTCTDVDVALKFLSMQQLLSGWLWVSEEGIEDELEMAQVRMQVDLSKAFFSVPRTGRGLERWERLLGGSAAVAAVAQQQQQQHEEQIRPELKTGDAPSFAVRVCSAMTRTIGMATCVLLFFAGACVVGRSCHSHLVIRSNIFSPCCHMLGPRATDTYVGLVNRSPMTTLTAWQQQQQQTRVQRMASFHTAEAVRA